MLDLNDPLIVESIGPIAEAARQLLDTVRAYQAAEIESADQTATARLSVAMQITKMVAGEIDNMEALEMGDAIAHLAASHVCGYRRPVRTHAMAHMQAVIEGYVERPGRGGG